MVKDWLYKKIAEEFHGVDFDILTPPEPELGDYSTNLVFALAKKDRRTPAEVGEEIAAKLSALNDFKKVFERIEFASPGFVNFYLSKNLTGLKVLRCISVIPYL